MKNNSAVVTIVIAIVVAVVAFFGGMKYDQSSAKTGNNMSQQSGYSGAGGFRRFGSNGQNNANVVRGQVVSSDANSITVKLSDGSSKIINISGNTMFVKSSKASQSDVQSGQTVAAFGMANSDGSIDAQSVQINPVGGFGRGARMQGSPSPTQ